MMRLLCSSVLPVLLVLGLVARVSAEPASRIVSVGGSITEIVYALGQGDRLVARDTTSNHPPAAQELPDVGYVRRLSAEGLLSMNPDLILAEEGAGPPEVLALLAESQIPLVTIPMGFDEQAVATKIEAVAQALGVPGQGAALSTDVASEINRATGGSVQGRKRVLFVLTLQGGRVLAGGANTAADGIIRLAGGENAATGFEGYKPMTDEAIIESGADVILMMLSRGDMHVSDADVMSHPALSATPAGQAGAVVRMDGMLLLGFSVRTGQAVTELAHALRKQNG